MTNLWISFPKRNGEYGNPVCVCLGASDNDADVAIRLIRTCNPTLKLMVSRETTLPFSDCDGTCASCPIVESCNLDHNVK